jgi:hypothetical protein
MLIILFLVIDTLNSFSDDFNNYLKVKRSSNPCVYMGPEFDEMRLHHQFPIPVVVNLSRSHRRTPRVRGFCFGPLWAQNSEIQIHHQSQGSLFLKQG